VRAANDLALLRALLRVRNGWIQTRRLDLRLGKMLELILHERDERRDDDNCPVQKHRRQLVAQRLAATGGQESQGITPSQHVLDELALSWPEQGRGTARLPESVTVLERPLHGLLQQLCATAQFQLNPDVLSMGLDRMDA
jgi:hypothetical protein